MARIAGRIGRVVGPVVEATGVTELRMLDMVYVGEENLVGEVMRLKNDRAFIQVYEDTTSLKAGEPVSTDGFPLSVELGPGLMSGIFDGILRPLEAIREKEGYFISRGVSVPPLDRRKKWHFVPRCKEGDAITGGSFIGEVPETPLIIHRILLSPLSAGTVKKVLPEGDYTVDETVAVLETDRGEEPVTMIQRWPVRRSRPVAQRFPVGEPLLTGQRVVDTLFPVAKGGCVAVPGGFGTGKTVIQHQLAKWSDAGVVIFVGCGERGNEMTDVLHTFPTLTDPRSGRPLMERTILIANTSNMPVAAREASIYTGITLAEYYRDMGYHVAMMADSTSRWAEALRELSGRLEEMPMEEGFPSYLPSRLAEFYERAGRVKTLGDRDGSITVIASVSPPGGDFSEPVTSHTRRFIRCFWALDRDLANARHYPSISWLDSYSEYLDDVKEWWHTNIDPEWLELRYTIMELLQKEQRLLQVAKLVGTDVLPNAQKLILEVCRLFKDGFLQQSAYDEVDACSSARKQFLMLKAIVTFHRKAGELIDKGIGVAELKEHPVYQDLMKMKFTYTERDLPALERLPAEVAERLEGLET